MMDSGDLTDVLLQTPRRAAASRSMSIDASRLPSTVSLVAVFIPVLFIGGVVGRLFNEFAPRSALPS